MLTSFRARLLLLFVGLAGSVLIATLIAVTVATENQAELTVERELTVSERVLGELISIRGEQLSQAAQVLADDFGFREAVASGDQATLISAMINHGERIGTQLMALYRPDGTQLASTHDLPASNSINDYRGIRRINDELFQLVTVPVRAPDVIAYATQGFLVDDVLAESLKQLTNADITFFDAQSGHIFASSLPASQRQTLVAATQEERVESWLNDEALAGHLSDFSSIHLLVSTSRSEATQEYRTLRTQYFGFGLASLLVALVLALVTARHFNKPLMRLTAAAAELQQGHYQGSIELDRGDEFGRLGEAFNSMRGAIAEREQRIMYQLEHDLLTNLPNRKSLHQYLTGELASRKTGRLLILNIARFRELNDRLGQRFGDKILQQVAQRLQDEFNNDCFVARLAGDEFILATAEKVSVDNLQQRLHRLVAKPWLVDDARYRLDFRAGLVHYPEQGDEVDVLLRRAQLAARQAAFTKQLMAVYSHGSDEEYMRRLQILQALPEAIAERKLELHFQPKIDCATGTVVGAEALIRWRHPQLGVIRPDEFIPLAEQSGDILAVTRWVCEAALNQQQYWLEQGRKLQMAINLSAKDLQDSSWLSFIKAELQQRHLPAETLTLEVTESAVMADVEQAQQQLTELRRLGVKIALDDYGTGYASLSQLKHLPVDELKLDQSFIRGLTDVENDRVIVRSTLELARQLKLETVAEGVEEEAAWRLLQTMGCVTLQGYFFSRPLAATEFENWLSTDASRFLQSSEPNKAGHDET
ncbi:Phytochrome-like protein cph2 [Pseudidiomarina piscicola]|uniref:Phytochrome-like protein cph2 n=1 Tax=Pseudidiomarina piscicola TaxID=2614830 RepID=A0A6S6WPR7_9GAMM|nr:EAL domain-containing protein [Pseudidiomarina piscicola]CAB0149629.1 Phytochrome-like protein cph2 [Pseudidiomarina piscicola]VZT39077.1 Phytochrome-like protein cph2 [Pseudomonas aeruginosa]